MNKSQILKLSAVKFRLSKYLDEIKPMLIDNTLDMI